MTTPASTIPASKSYIHGYHPSVLKSHSSRTISNSVSYLLPHLSTLPSTAKILDVGCGPGTITVEFCQYAPSGQVIGLDSTLLPNTAEISANRNIPEERLQWITGDVQNLPFGDGEFDMVHAHQVLQHLSDPIKAFAEMKRVTKSGGFVAIREADFGAFTYFPSDEYGTDGVGLDKWLALYTKLAKKAGAEPHAGRRLKSWAINPAVGFNKEKVKCTSSNWTYSGEEERKWWGGMWAERVLKSDFADGVRRFGLASEEELEEIAEGWRSWVQAEEGWFMVPSGEVVCWVD